MKKIYLFLTVVALTFSACSDSYMEEVNTDDSKAASIEPSAQLTTALLQTYGDFGMMDTYRSYITGFTQHFAGGWNVSNYAGAVHAQDDQMRLVWDQLYAVSIKNIVDAIANSTDKPNTNAALRIHRVYLMSQLTDIYGDIPCKEAGLGFVQGINNPKYDTQEEIYMGRLPLFWVPMQNPKVRMLLAQYSSFFDDNNVVNQPSWDQIFLGQIYSAFVTHESNHYDRSITQYLTGEDAILESAEIEEHVFDIENGMWDY